MKVTNHSDKTKSIRLTQEEQAWLWSLVREGRRAVCKNDEGEVHDFAINTMLAVQPNIKGYVDRHMEIFDRDDENFAYHILKTNLKEVGADVDL